MEIDKETIAQCTSWEEIREQVLIDALDAAFNPVVLAKYKEALFESNLRTENITPLMVRSLYGKAALIDAKGKYLCGQLIDGIDKRGIRTYPWSGKERCKTLANPEDYHPRSERRVTGHMDWRPNKFDVFLWESEDTISEEAVKIASDRLTMLMRLDKLTKSNYDKAYSAACRCLNSIIGVADADEVKCLVPLSMLMADYFCYLPQEDSIELLNVTMSKVKEVLAQPMQDGLSKIYSCDLPLGKKMRKQLFADRVAFNERFWGLRGHDVWEDVLNALVYALAGRNVDQASEIRAWVTRLCAAVPMDAGVLLEKAVGSDCIFARVRNSGSTQARPRSVIFTVTDVGTFKGLFAAAAPFYNNWRGHVAQVGGVGHCLKRLLMVPCASAGAAEDSSILAGFGHLFSSTMIW